MPWRDPGQASQQPQRQGRWRERSVSSDQAFLRGLGDSVSLSLGDEIRGGVAGLQALGQGQDFMDAYNRQTAQSRANLREARDEQPWATGGGELAGYLVPGFIAGRAGRVGLGVGGRLATAAGVGAGFGGVSGFGSGENMQERFQHGAAGAALGAAFGAGAQGVFGELGPMAWRAGRRTLGLPATRERLGVAERALDDLMTSAKQNERLGVRSVDDLQNVINQAAAREPTLTVAEALGRSAINRAVKYSRLPGRTAETAERTLERNADTFAALESRLDRFAPRNADGSPLTLRGAGEELDAAFAQASTEGYERALANDIGMAQAERMQSITQRHPELYNRALEEARILARGEGVRFGGPTDPRLWHYVKVAAGDTIRSMRREGLGATRARQYTQSLRRLVDELDNVPGYRAARQKWGSLSEAREAIEAGYNFERMRPEDMSAFVSRLTPFQQRYLQSGVAERIRDTLARSDFDGLNNISKMLIQRRRGDLLRSAFGNARSELDDFLQYARLRHRMHQDARRMASSQESPTGIVTGEGLAEAIPTGAISLKAGALRLAYRNSIGRIGERNRDILGRVLHTPVGDASKPIGGLLSRAIRESARRRYRTRLQRTRGAYIAGTGGMGAYDMAEN